MNNHKPKFSFWNSFEITAWNRTVRTQTAPAPAWRGVPIVTILGWRKEIPKQQCQQRRDYQHTSKRPLQSRKKSRLRQRLPENQSRRRMGNGTMESALVSSRESFIVTFGTPVCAPRSCWHRFCNETTSYGWQSPKISMARKTKIPLLHHSFFDGPFGFCFVWWRWPNCTPSIFCSNSRTTPRMFRPSRSVCFGRKSSSVLHWACPYRFGCCWW